MCTHTYTPTPHLIIIILAEKGRVRDQLWPNPRMHCTSVSATSISFFPLGTICHEADFTAKGMKALPKDRQHFSLCPASCVRRRRENMNSLLTLSVSLVFSCSIIKPVLKFKTEPANVLHFKLSLFSYCLQLSRILSYAKRCTGDLQSAATGVILKCCFVCFDNELKCHNVKKRKSGEASHMY